MPPKLWFGGLSFYVFACWGYDMETGIAALSGIGFFGYGKDVSKKMPAFQLWQSAQKIFGMELSCVAGIESANPPAKGVA